MSDNEQVETSTELEEKDKASEKTLRQKRKDTITEKSTQVLK